MGGWVIDFYLNAKSGVAPYMQLIQQVRHALRIGVLHEGDRLPTVKEVVARLAINPNTVSKAYRELEYEGLVTARQGLGTFIVKTLGCPAIAAREPLRQNLERWLTEAREAGLDDDSIEALFLTTFRAFSQARA